MKAYIAFHPHPQEETLEFALESGHASEFSMVPPWIYSFDAEDAQQRVGLGEAAVHVVQTGLYYNPLPSVFAVDAETLDDWVGQRVTVLDVDQYPNFSYGEKCSSVCQGLCLAVPEGASSSSASSPYTFSVQEVTGGSWESLYPGGQGSDQAPVRCSDLSSKQIFEDLLLEYLTNSDLSLPHFGDSTFLVARQSLDLTTPSHHVGVTVSEESLRILAERSLGFVLVTSGPVLQSPCVME